MGSGDAEVRAGVESRRLVHAAIRRNWDSGSAPADYKKLAGT